ncbi:PQQ-binding-like beta-propeller repeat protein, partial [Candidatus Woesearchaeota archaeon]|nr:PQQ-binding-like beta-propeller repeat protein [Candidatus Woesearchaeota archaeon]
STNLYNIKSSPLVTNNLVFFGSDNKTYALNITNGQIVWNYSTGDWVRSSPSIADGIVYVGSKDGKLYAFGVEDITPPSFTQNLTNQVIELGKSFIYDVNATDNKGVVTYHLIDPTGNLSINQSGVITYTNQLITGTYELTVIINDTANNQNNQSFNLTIFKYSTVTSSNSTSTSEWRMFGRTLDHQRHYPENINLTDFGLLWNFSVQNTYFNETIISDGISYLSGADWVNPKLLYALNASNGETIWEFNSSANYRVTPSISEDILFSVMGSNAFALNKTNGVQVWNKSGIGVQYNNHLVYNNLLFHNGKVLNASTGNNLWNNRGSLIQIIHHNYLIIRYGNISVYNTSDGSLVYSKSYVGGGTVGLTGYKNGFFYNEKGGDDLGYLFYINLSDGNILLNVSSTGCGHYRTHPSISGDYLILSCSYKNITRAINVTNGDFIWNITSPYNYAGVATTMPSQALIGNENGELIILNLSSGQELLKVQTGVLTDFASPFSPFSIADNRIFVPGRDKVEVYAAGASPRIMPITPLNTTVSSLNPYEFIFSVTDNSDVNLSCNLSVSGSVFESYMVVQSGIQHSINLSLPVQNHTWFIGCWDSMNNFVRTNEYNLNILGVQCINSSAVNLTAVLNTDASILLSWQNDTNLETVSYNIYRKNSSITNISTLDRIAENISDNSWVDTNVSTNTTYFYVITSVDIYSSENLSAFSDVVNVTTPLSCSNAYTCGSWSSCSSSSQSRTCSRICYVSVNNLDSYLDTQSCSSGGGGGGGGGGGSLDTLNILVNVIDVGEEKQVIITSEELGIYEAVVNVSEKVDNIKFTFSKLDNKPSGTTDPKSGEKIFKYLEIKVSKDGDKIKKLKFKFKLEKSWLEQNNLSKKLVRMFRFTTKWDELKTNIKSDDITFVYYETETPGLSFFKIATVEEEPTPSETEQAINQLPQQSSSSSNEANINNDQEEQEVIQNTTQVQEETIKKPKKYAMIILITLIILGLIGALIAMKLTKKPKSPFR